MYHPSRGGVRGGSDQFSWDTVKSDKHRENYLGHSVMAPVGRWQKGKDLSWYSKERNTQDSEYTEKSEQLAAIKKTEEDAMLVALGLKSAGKEVKSLAREDVAAALKRNATERDVRDTEIIAGVGMESGHNARRINGNKQNEGVIFETFQGGKKLSGKHYDHLSTEKRRSKPCKKLKKEKKEKSKKHKHKKKKRKRESSSEISDLDVRQRKKKRHHS